MPPPNMRSIFAKVHQTSKSVVSRRNFSSPAAGDGKEPKEKSSVGSVVARTLLLGAMGYVSGTYVGTYLETYVGTEEEGKALKENLEKLTSLKETLEKMTEEFKEIENRVSKLEDHLEILKGI
ncbi:unnamed protein product [Eruca vesicaria subsp. sativa]|uniref:Uncharacterized protein n=1 Tax=Eruca vesicaria subsp. sativa TaxID=29727 RepID=A0ABC8J663_ERUVS|nr:unnamed protein product [Eruca vesicaria subsp. sativa]